MKKNQNPDILSPQQQTLLACLLPVARIATNGCSENLPVRPRTHTIVAGPSGSGESHLARRLSVSLGISALVVNVSSWVVLSARNEPWTFSLICEWLGTLDGKGGILVLEEIDKLTNGEAQSTNGGWLSFIRLEMHDLLDGIIPHAARLPSVPSDELWEVPSTETPDSLQRDVLSKCLRDRVFIVACGAWQHAYRSNSRRIGFGSGTNESEPPSREQILKSIEPELRQRFRSEVGWLPPLALSDYLTVSTKIANRISDPRIRSAWTRLSGPAIEEAVAGCLGMRIFEELMLAAVLETQSHDEPDSGNFSHPEM